MQHEILYAESSFDQIRIFCEFAEKHKTDFQLPGMRKFLEMPLSELCKFVRSKYLRESGEQILRPIYFAKIGSDCDDGTIFIISCFLAAGIQKKDIYIVEAKENPQEKEYVHIFCALKDPINGKMLWLDNLPGTEFNRLGYSMAQIRITPLTDYI